MFLMFSCRSGPGASVEVVGCWPCAQQVIGTVLSRPYLSGVCSTTDLFSIYVCLSGFLLGIGEVLLGICEGSLFCSGPILPWSSGSKSYILQQAAAAALLKLSCRAGCQLCHVVWLIHHCCAYTEWLSIALPTDQS